MKCFLNILIGIVAVASVSCESSSEDPSPVYDYFPLRTGAYQIYDVEEITYELGDPDTSHYEIRMVVVDSFPNDRSSAYTYVIHRSKRLEAETTWKYLDTWSAEKDSREVVVSEQNIPFVKLRFPAIMGATWDGNMYNDLVMPSSNQHEDIYEIIDEGNSLTLGDVQLENFVKVEQEDNQEFVVYFDKRNEIYAADVGLVFREIEQLQYCTDDQCLGDKIVETGVVYRQTITAYGQE